MKKTDTPQPRTLDQIDADLSDKLHFRLISKARGETRTQGFDALLDERLAVMQQAPAEDIRPTAKSPYPLAMKRR